MNHFPKIFFFPAFLPYYLRQVSWMLGMLTCEPSNCAFNCGGAETAALKQPNNYQRRLSQKKIACLLKQPPAM